MMIYPRTDIFDICKFVDVTFWPLHRQEMSRTAGGRAQVKDFGSPLWRASFTSRPERLADAAELEAAILSLNGAAGSFLAYDPRRPYPRAHADGFFDDEGTIGELFVDDPFRIGLAELMPGFELSPGDYLGFQYGARRALHVVTVGGLADVSGDVDLSIYPPIRPGALTGAAVSLKRPVCEMSLEPGFSPPSMRDMVASSLSFSAFQLI